MSVDLEEALASLAPRVLRYVAARTGDVSLAEEIAQECLAALVRHWRNGGGPPQSPDAFVFSIARRRAGRAVLRRRVWLPLERASAAQAASPSPEAWALAREEQLRVRSALGRLSRRDREAILMVAVGGLTMATAAGVLGVTVSAVKMRVSRARARLVTMLEDAHDTRPAA
jgi:RNA polymerase sigma-70 factor, ECF subfamily